jgi:hypothetical protein
MRAAGWLVDQTNRRVQDILCAVKFDLGKSLQRIIFRPPRGSLACLVSVRRVLVCQRRHSPDLLETSHSWAA